MVFGVLICNRTHCVLTSLSVVEGFIMLLEKALAKKVP